MEEVEYLNQLLGDLFKQSDRRADAAEHSELHGHVPETPIRTEDSAERLAVCVGSLFLLLIRSRGGTRLPQAPLEQLVQRALEGCDGRGRAWINDEVTRILDWLAEVLLDKGEAIEPQSWGDVHYDAAAYLPFIKEAIENKEDLEIEYFSYHRGEWNHRRVTPTRLDGRSTLVGHCHLRGTERRFRLSRIRSLFLAKPSATMANVVRSPGERTLAPAGPDHDGGRTRVRRNRGPAGRDNS